MLQWAKRLLGRLIGLVAILALTGVVYQLAATTIDTYRYPPPGKLVNVGNHRLHLNCAGEGSPAVVMEAGGGAWSLDWSWVQPEIAKITHVCSYDRAGYGWSDSGPTPHTSQQIINELQALLVKAGIDGPYVLVGSSFGGYNVRLYASKLPDEVAGMVLIDVSHEDQHSPMPPECWKQQLQQVRTGWVLAAVGLVRLFGALGLAPDIEELVTKFPSDVQPIARASYYRERFFRTLLDELANYEESTAQLRAATRPLGDKPLAVLTAGAYEYPSYCRVTQDQKDKLNQQWMDRHRELAGLSSNSTHIVAEKSGHRIHLDRPALIVDAIRKVVEEARR